jgi:polysaccharide export outer membrane protein
MSFFRHLISNALVQGLTLALIVVAGLGTDKASAATAPHPAPAAGTAPTAAAGGAPVADYRLGTGDVLHIIVYQNPDLTLDARLSDSGFISFPLLGALKVGGLTVGETEALIANGLKKGDFVKNPQVTVVIMQVRGSQVSVLGQVNRPGRYPLEQAQTRLSDVLALAGGVAATAGSDIVTIVGKRDGKPMRLEIDLPRVFAARDPLTDITLQNNDVVWVDRAPVVYIYGEVQRPGPMRVERGMTVMQALATGGGLTQRGTERGITIHRRNEATGAIEELKPTMDSPVRDGDVIYVRESLF